MNLPLLLAGGAAALGLPGFFLLLRSGRLATLAAVVLLLGATALGYAAVRAQAAPAVPGFRLAAPPGQFQAITVAELPAALAAARGRPVLLEFWAEWCPSCIKWKQDVFSRTDVQATLAPAVLLQVDATEMTPEVQALLDRHGLAGLPALLVFDREGREQPGLRLLGEMPAPAFMAWVQEKMLPGT